MKIQPLHDRLVVKRVNAQETTKSGIIIPDNAREKPIEGEVLAVGLGKILDNGNYRMMTVEVGDVVLFDKHAGTDVKIENEEYLILKEEDLLGIVRAPHAT